jgi:hypothetical protein
MYIQTDTVVLRWSHNNEWQDFGELVIRLGCFRVIGFKNLGSVSPSEIVLRCLRTFPDLKNALWSFGFNSLKPFSLGLDHASVSLVQFSLRIQRVTLTIVPTIVVSYGLETSEVWEELAAVWAELNWVCV